MLLEQLPNGLEDAEALIKRRMSAKQRKDQFQSLYTEAMRYAMPARDTFTYMTPGAEKNSRLFDSTLQELTYEAANTLCALLFPSWKRWMELAFGGSVPREKIDTQMKAGLQEAGRVFFDFLHTSNFESVINEVALDLMIGTGGLAFDEGDNEQPFVFTSTPLAALELEEGPNGTIETKFMYREPTARNIVRMYKGMSVFDLSPESQDRVAQKPDECIPIVQGEVYDPVSKHYFGTVIEVAQKNIAWRWDYGPSCPGIVARATKVSGEIYGRGRVLQALADARTLDKMVEFLLRQAAIQIAPPMTGVSDGVMNPYTTTIAPMTVIPVASNDNANPSLRVLEVGGNFNITDKLLDNLRERLRRAMLGPDMSQSQPLSATEVSIADRNRLWAMNGEFGRIQYELLMKIVTRGVYILQKKGLIPKFKVDGRETKVVFTSPFSRSQNSEDILALQQTLATITPLGPAVVGMGLKTSDITEWVADKSGLDMALVNSRDEREELENKTADAAGQAMANGADPAMLAQMAQGAA